MFGLSSDMLQRTGALILVCESTIEDEKSAFRVSCAYVFFCPFLKFYTYPPYSTNKAYQQIFLAQSILSLIKEEIDL